MSRDIPYDEWRKLQKSPAKGGVQSALSPAAGSMAAGYMPGTRGPSIGLDAAQAGPSKYQLNAPAQPQPWIDDVDMESNWYSPMQPIAPFGPPSIAQPREWDYPTGYNINYIPARMELMAMLRGLRASWGVLSTIISTRQDQLLRIPWTIQRRDKPRARSAAVDEMRKFLKRPDGKLSFSQWTRKLLDDLLVLDAPSIYFARNRVGKLIAAECLDGATIFPLIDDTGRRPDSTVEMTEDGRIYLQRQPAFQQIIKGFPMIDLDESELMYAPMRPRPNLPMFGYPPTEQILIEASEAVRKTFYQLNFWAEGTIPDLIVTVPKEWSPRQIAMFQGHFDALLSGNVSLKSKVRFLPGDMKPFDIKNSSGESLWSQRDETLIRLACYAYSVSPTPFVKQTNRSVAQNAQQTAEEEGLYPLMSYWKDDIMDPIIQEKFGYEDIEFVFQPRPEPDQEKAAKIHDMKIKNGEMSRNEAREEDGLEPIEAGDVFTVQVGNAIVPLEMAAAGHAMPMMGGVGQGGESSSGGTSTQRPPAAQNVPQRGAAKPSHQTTSPSAASPVHKGGPDWIDPSGTPFSKATPAELATAASDAKGDLATLSHVQQHVGNYPKGHIWIQGLNISIENAPGSKRGEKDQHGVKWEVTMPSAYGYIRGTIGADGDALDCYIGKHPTARTVWVIDQNTVGKKSGKIKGFDEHKAMICYDSLEEALFDYLASHFDGLGHQRLDKVTELSMREFKTWLANGDLKAPIADQVGRVILNGKALRKAGDTISSATGLSWSGFGPPPAAPQPSRRRRKRKAKALGPRWKQLQASL